MGVYQMSEASSSSIRQKWLVQVIATREKPQLDQTNTYTKEIYPVKTVSMKSESGIYTYNCPRQGEDMQQDYMQNFGHKKLIWFLWNLL